MKTPYHVVKRRYVTEKTTVLENLKSAAANKSQAACTSPKYAFIVADTASKPQIAQAIEEIYKSRKVKVVKVNTVRSKSKPKRMRGRIGRKPGFKKAIVTLGEGQALEEV